jgi:hypothetical protein
VSGLTTTTTVPTPSPKPWRRGDFVRSLRSLLSDLGQYDSVTWYTRDGVPLSTRRLAAWLAVGVVSPEAAQTFERDLLGL